MPEVRGWLSNSRNVATLSARPTTRHGQHQPGLSNGGVKGDYTFPALPGPVSRWQGYVHQTRSARSDHMVLCGGSTVMYLSASACHKRTLAKGRPMRQLGAHSDRHRLGHSSPPSRLDHARAGLQRRPCVGRVVHAVSATDCRRAPVWPSCIWACGRLWPRVRPFPHPSASTNQTACHANGSGEDLFSTGVRTVFPRYPAYQTSTRRCLAMSG